MRKQPSHEGRLLPVRRRGPPLQVSIHALARRATSMAQTFPPGMVRFQSTPSHGGRRSAHRCGCGRRHGFNPRPRTEGDTIFSVISASGLEFQSTPSHGGRHGTEIKGGSIKTFQSTPSHGGRPPGRRSRHRQGSVSIHALARRATYAVRKFEVTQEVSIHALARRATRLRGRRGLPLRCFNPRPRTEGDSSSLCTCSRTHNPPTDANLLRKRPQKQSFRCRSRTSH